MMGMMLGGHVIPSAAEESPERRLDHAQYGSRPAPPPAYPARCARAPFVQRKGHAYIVPAGLPLRSLNYDGP